MVIKLYTPKLMFNSFNTNYQTFISMSYVFKSYRL